jgi:hypothetical protein
MSSRLIERGVEFRLARQCQLYRAALPADVEPDPRRLRPPDEAPMSDPIGPIDPNANGRVPGGRFAPGHTYSRGPRHTRMAALRAALLDSATPEDVRAVGTKLAELARGGDVQAAKVWLDFVVGKPPQAVELTGADGESLGLDWSRVEAAVLAALAPFGGQARFAVALALRGVVTDADRAEQPGDLLNFKVKVTAAAHETFSAREGAHDDLVLAVAVAAWLGEHPVPQQKVYARGQGEED